MFRGIIRKGAALILALTAIMSADIVGQVMVGAGQAQAQSFVIRSINVTGNKRVEAETVKSYLTFSVGDHYSPMAADESFKALFATGLFSDVNIAPRGSSVVVHVVENPVINRVAFEGNDELDDATLRKEVQLHQRSVYSRAAVQADVQRIISVYHSSGYYSVQVEAKIIKLPYNRVDLVLEIREGTNTKVLGINFIGNKAYSDSQLRDVISTSEHNLLSFLKPTDIYDPDRLNLDRELLRRFYLTNGYPDVRIISAAADLAPDGKGFFITFTLDEGPLYHFGAIRIESAIPGINPETLRGNLLTEEGGVYNALQIDRTSEKLTVAAAEQGYAFAQAHAHIERDPVTRTMSVTYTIQQGPRIYIERINIIGNTRTRDYVIRREFRIAEGDAYNKLMIEQARKRLQAMRFFQSVKVTREAGSAPDRVRLNVIVVEQATGELSFSAGYSTLEGVIGEVSYTERNLMGRGQYLRVALSGSIERLQFDVSFTEPRFLDRNMALGFDAFHKELDYSSEAGYKDRKSGGGVRLGFALDDHLYLTNRYTLTHEEVYDVNPATASTALQDIEGTSVISSLSYSLVYDTRNLARNPTRGIYVSLSQELAGPGGSVNYLRSVAEARAYYPLLDQVTLVGRLIGGHIEGWGGDDVRIVDAFYKGGDIVRGFKNTGLGPRDSNTGDALGGKTFYAGTVEVRFPFPFIPDEFGFSGAVFADAGTVYGTDVPDVPAGSVEDSDVIRASVGASILWNSPVGPLRADFAYVLNKADFDETEVFSFGASSKF